MSWKSWPIKRRNGSATLRVCQRLLHTGNVQRQRWRFTATLNDTLALARLQAWYQKHCNGEWENDLGVSIESTDNPGWWVKIDLRGTELESKSFAEVRRGETETPDPQPPWMHCYIDEKRVFNGAGDPTTLQEILSTFLANGRTMAFFRCLNKCMANNRCTGY